MLKLGLGFLKHWVLKQRSKSKVQVDNSSHKHFELGALTRGRLSSAQPVGRRCSHCGSLHSVGQLQLYHACLKSHGIVGWSCCRDLNSLHEQPLNVATRYKIVPKTCACCKLQHIAYTAGLSSRQRRLQPMAHNFYESIINNGQQFVQTLHGR